MKARERNRLVRVAELALAAGRAELPDYSCPKSPRKFTQPQLLACLVVKAYQRQTYQGAADLLAASDALRAALGLTRVPDQSTLCRFADRAAGPAVIDRVLGRVLAQAGPAVGDAAMDSTGLDPGTASAHYQARRGTTHAGYVKVSVVVLCGSLLPLAVVVSRGPRPDATEAPDLLARARAKGTPARLFADRGYDAESVHRFCYEEWGTESYIPPVIKRKDGTAGGRYRSRMTELPADYGKRWHAESFFSGLKRTTGSRLAARKPAAQDAEAALRVLAYAVRRPPGCSQ
jgi:Transposase DDE domain